MMTENYPYDQTNWTASDQRYWFKMCRSYRYPVSAVRDPYKQLIQENKDDVWEEEYDAYLTSQSV